MAVILTISIKYGRMRMQWYLNLKSCKLQSKKETLNKYDLSSSLELGKFLPQQYNIHIPMYVGYSETFITPQYNPLDPDILLAPTLKDGSLPKNVRDSIKHVTEDYTKRRSI